MTRKKKEAQPPVPRLGNHGQKNGGPKPIESAGMVPLPSSQLVGLDLSSCRCIRRAKWPKPWMSK